MFCSHGVPTLWVTLDHPMAFLLLKALCLMRHAFEQFRDLLAKLFRQLSKIKKWASKTEYCIDSRQAASLVQVRVIRITSALRRDRLHTRTAPSPPSPTVRRRCERISKEFCRSFWQRHCARGVLATNLLESDKHHLPPQIVPAGDRLRGRNMMMLCCQTDQKVEMWWRRASFRPNHETEWVSIMT